MATTREQLEELARKAYGPNARIVVVDAPSSEKRVDIGVEYTSSTGRGCSENLAPEVLSFESGADEAANELRFTIEKRQVEPVRLAARTVAQEMHGIHANVYIGATRMPTERDQWTAHVSLPGDKEPRIETFGATARDALSQLLAELSAEHEERESSIRSAFESARAAIAKAA